MYQGSKVNVNVGDDESSTMHSLFVELFEFCCSSIAEELKTLL